METLQRGLDEKIAELRRGSFVREYGWTTAFVAVGLVALRYLLADWSGPSFQDRLIGNATLADADIAARGRVFAQCLVLFLGALALSTWCLPRIARVLGAEAWRAIEGTSAAGLLLIVLTTWRVQSIDTLALLGIVLILIVATTFLDKWTRTSVVRERGAYVGWVMGTGFALGVPLYDLWPVVLPKGVATLPCLVLACALAIDVGRRIVVAWPVRSRGAPSTSGGEDALRRARDTVREARFDRFVHALTPIAVLAAAPVLRNELYFLLNQWGVLTIKPDYVELATIALLLVWCATRALRTVPVDASGRLDLERTIGRFTFPWIVGGTMAVLRFLFDCGASPDFFEPANSGLMIQQWFDFGRLPFFETFSAHGLADSIFGFLYSVFTGFRDESWGMWDYLYPVLGVVVAFHVVRAWLSSANAALFVVVGLPFLNWLFPAYCVHVAVSVFVVVWVFQRRTAWAWAVFTWWCAFVFVWRLDMGFANVLASAFALVGAVIVLPEHRPPLSAMVRGALGAGATLLLAYLGVCWWRGIDPIALLLDFKAVVGSNQAFGFEDVARRKTEIVMTHVFVVPMVVTLTCLVMFVRARGRIDRAHPAFFAVLGTAFFTAYYFANYPRGLVRHTFLEGSNVMLASFALLVVAGSCRWWMPHARRVTVFGVFCALTAALGFNVDIEHADGREVTTRAATTERIGDVLRGFERVRYTPATIDRSFMVPWFPPRNTQKIVPFFARELGPRETFLDLSNSPMLYFHAKRVSPHWLNHLLIVCGDRLQKSLLKGLESYDVPFVVLSTIPARAVENGMAALTELDGVPFTLRHYRLHEWVHEHYDPLTAVGRWQIWIRRDRLLVDAPASESKRRLFSWSEAATTSDGSVGSPESTAGSDLGRFTVAFGDAAPIVQARRVMIAPDKSYVVRIAGRADVPGRVELELALQQPHGPQDLVRSLAFPAGDSVRWYRIPCEPGFRTLKRLSVKGSSGVDLRDLELWELVSADGAESDAYAQRILTDELRALPRIWGEQSADASEKLVVLRDLLDPATLVVPRTLTPAPMNEFPWRNGILTTKAAFLRDDSCLDVPLAVGDTLTFAHSGQRKVRELRGRVVFVEGELLSPELDGAPALVRRWDWAAPNAGDDLADVRAGRRFSFAPIELQETHGSGCYLMLRARRTNPECKRVIVDYGRGENGVGRFVFELADDDAVHEYLVRLSTHYNWSHRPNTWILLSPEGGGIRLEQLRLTVGD